MAYSLKAQAFFDRVEADGGTIESKDFVAQQLDNLDGRESLSFIAGAYKIGKVYVAVPADGSKDMSTYTRASASTRFNKYGQLETLDIDEPCITYLDEKFSQPVYQTSAQTTNYCLNSEPTATQLTDSNIAFESFDWDCGFFTNCVTFGDNSVQRNMFHDYNPNDPDEFVSISFFVQMDDNSKPVLGTDTVSGDFSVIGDGVIADYITGDVRRVSSMHHIYRVMAVIRIGATPSNIYGIEKYVGQSSKGFKVTGFMFSFTVSSSSTNPNFPYLRTTGATVSQAQSTVGGGVNNSVFIAENTNDDLLSQDYGSWFFKGIMNTRGGATFRTKNLANDYQGTYSNSWRALCNVGGVGYNSSQGFSVQSNKLESFGSVYDLTSQRPFSEGVKGNDILNSTFGLMPNPSAFVIFLSTSDEVMSIQSVSIFNEAISNADGIIQSDTSDSQADAYIKRVLADGGIVENIEKLHVSISQLDQSEAIVLVPSGYKEGKMYSLLPNDGTGDFTFGRSSSGTRINEEGLVKIETNNFPRLDNKDGKAGLLIEKTATNLIADSKLLSSFSSTPTPNSGIAPNGLNEALRYTVNGNSAAFEYIGGLGNWTAGATATIQFWTKRASGQTQTHQRVTTNNYAAWSSGISIKTDVSDGEWHFVTFTGVLQTGSTSLKLMLTSYDENASSDIDCIGDFLIWGLDVKTTDLASSYIETTGSSVTRATEILSLDNINLTSLIPLAGEFSIILDMHFLYKRGGGGTGFFKLHDVNNEEISFYHTFLITGSPDLAQWTTIPASGFAKIGLTANATEIKLYTNGVLRWTAPAGSTTQYFNSDLDGLLKRIQVHSEGLAPVLSLNKIMVYPSELSGDKVINLTSEFPVYSNGVDANVSFCDASFLAEIVTAVGLGERHETVNVATTSLAYTINDGVVQDFVIDTIDYPIGDVDYPRNDLHTWSFLLADGYESFNLHFTFFDVELNYDYLWVYSGTDDTGTLIAQLHGTSLPNDIFLETDVFLKFTSDAGVEDRGFIVEVRKNFSTAVPADVDVNDTTTNLSFVAEVVTVEVIDDAQTFINAVGTLTVPQENAIKDLVTGLKANGTWTKYQAIYPFIGGTASAHKWNLKDPLDTDVAFRLSFGGGIVHSATGAKPDGTTGFGNTFYNPSLDGTTDNAMLSYYSRDDIIITAIEMGYISGGYGATPRFNLEIDYNSAGTKFDCYSSAVGRASGTPIGSDGWIVGSRVSSSDNRVYQNGTQIGTTNPSNGGTIPNDDVYIFSVNLGGSQGAFSSRECAFSTIGLGLTATEVSDDYDVIQAYQTALGRAVGTSTNVDVNDTTTNINLLAEVVTAEAIQNVTVDLTLLGLDGIIESVTVSTEVIVSVDANVSTSTSSFGSDVVTVNTGVSVNANADTTNYNLVAELVSIETSGNLDVNVPTTDITLIAEEVVAVGIENVSVAVNDITSNFLTEQVTVNTEIITSVNTDTISITWLAEVVSIETAGNLDVNTNTTNYNSVVEEVSVSADGTVSLGVVLSNYDALDVSIVSDADVVLETLISNYVSQIALVDVSTGLSVFAETTNINYEVLEFSIVLINSVDNVADAIIGSFEALSPLVSVDISALANELLLVNEVLDVSVDLQLDVNVSNISLVSSIEDAIIQVDVETELSTILTTLQIRPIGVTTNFETIEKYNEIILLSSVIKDNILFHSAIKDEIKFNSKLK